MILQCPSCSTRFLVDSALIPPQGREVKCAKCSHEWYAESDNTAPSFAPLPDIMSARVGDEHPEVHNDEGALMAEEAYDDEPEPQGQTVDSLPNMPEFKEPEFTGISPSLPSVSAAAPKPVMPLMAASLVLLLLVGITSLYAFRHSLQENMPAVYDLLGMKQTTGLALADVQMRERPSRNKARYVVEGYILNESDADRSVPVLRVSIMDKAGETLLMREYEGPPDAVIKPGEHFAFKAGNLDTAFVDRIDHLLVEIGNGVQLMLRQ